MFILTISVATSISSRGLKMLTNRQWTHIRKLRMEQSEQAPKL